MNITENIQNLLYRHDCIILPGFGGFVANYKPAKVDYDRSFFSPPSKEISFNSQLQHNDGLLISDVSRSSGLAYIDAKKNVDEYVSEIKSKLEKGKKVVLEELGSFHFDKESLLQFEPDRSRNYLVDSFGLTSFEFSELEEYDVRKRIQTKQVAKASPTTNRRKIIRRVLIAVPILVALVVIPLKTNILSPKKDYLSMDPFNQTELSNTSTSITKNELTTKKVDSASLVPEIKEQESKPGDEIKSEDSETEILSEDLNENNNTATNSSVISPQYYIIAGSFESEINATRLHTNLVKDGYSSKVMDASNGFYRVALSGFSNYWEAKKGMLEFKENYPNEAYWIWKD